MQIRLLAIAAYVSSIHIVWWLVGGLPRVLRKRRNVKLEVFCGSGAGSTRRAQVGDDDIGICRPPREGGRQRSQDSPFASPISLGRKSHNNGVGGAQIAGRSLSEGRKPMNLACSDPPLLLRLLRPAAVGDANTSSCDCCVRFLHPHCVVACRGAAQGLA